MPPMRTRSSLPGLARASACALLAAALAGAAPAQDRQGYTLGEGQRLMIVVHVLGEVKSPGPYSVEDNTTVMELVSRAGGPTEFASLGSVRLTRVEHRPIEVAATAADVADDSTHVIRVDLDAYLNGKNRAPLPILGPGDIVTVPRNGWFHWRRIAGIARDLSVVASAYFLYLRAVNNN